MPEHVSNSQTWLIASAILLLSILSASPAQAGSQVFIGVTTSIIPSKSCSEKPEHTEITLVFDGDSKSALSGWFYGQGTMTAEFKRITPTRFEVTNSSTIHHKLPPSMMELVPVKDGFHAVVKDYIPEDKEISNVACFFEKMEVDLKPLTGSPADSIKRGKDLLAADIIMLEGSDFLWNKKDYKAAIDCAQKVLLVYDGAYGKWNKVSLNASGIITFALMNQDRFDEALEVITPYRKSLPDDDLVKAIVEKILKLKKNQDDLFRYDPDSPSAIDLEPLG
jgi:hypothetical protein